MITKDRQHGMAAIHINTFRSVEATLTDEEVCAHVTYVEICVKQQKQFSKICREPRWSNFK